MKTVKKIMAALIIVTMLLSVAPLTGKENISASISKAASTIQSGNFSYTLDTKNNATISVPYSKKNLTGHIEIPSEIDGYPVVKINDFRSCKFSSVTIPATIQSIEDKAFYDCVNLTKVYYNAAECADFKASSPFYRCTILSEIIFGSSVKVIPKYFLYCGDSTNLPIKKLVIPNNVKSIHDDAFRKLYKLETVEIGKGLNEIGDRVFYECSSLVSFDVDLLNPNAFNDKFGALYCNNELIQFPAKSPVTDYVMPIGITNIRISAAESCDNLVRVKISDDVRTISERAFYDCTNLETLIFGEELIRVDKDAFSECISLKTIYIFKNVTKFCEDKSNYVFFHCDNNIKDVYYEGTSAEFSKIDGSKKLLNWSFRYASMHYNWVPTYDIIYDANTGVNPPEQQKKKKNVPIALRNEVPNKEYIVTYVGQNGTFGNTAEVDVPFSHWNTRKDGTGTSYDSGETYSANEAVILFAQWGAAKIENLPTVKYDGYVFQGWFTDKVGGAKVTTDTEITDDITLYAQWKERTGDPIMYGIEIDKSLSLNVGDKGTIDYAIDKESGAVVTLKWKSSNTSVVKVDSMGNVTAIKPGKATITCTASDGVNQFKDTCIVTVVSPRVYSVSVPDITMNYKDSAKITPNIVADPGAEYTITYSSSNSKYVRVDSNGKVYGAKKGSAVITCTVADTNGNAVSDSCTVKVKYSGLQWFLVIVCFGWIWM